jgi:hypothetical protein
MCVASDRVVVKVGLSFCMVDVVVEAIGRMLHPARGNSMHAEWQPLQRQRNSHSNAACALFPTPAVLSDTARCYCCCCCLGQPECMHSAASVTCRQHSKPHAAAWHHYATSDS